MDTCLFHIGVILSMLYFMGSTASRNDGTRIVVEQSPDIIGKHGGSVDIECKVEHNSSFTLFWTRGCENNQRINKEGRITFESLNRFINISNLTESDSGIYCCHVESVEGEKARGNGTRLEVTKTCPEDTGGDVQEYLPYMVIGLLIFIIIVLLAVLMKYCYIGPPVRQKRDHTEEPATESELNYAEIRKTNIGQHSRTRHMENTVIYSAVKTTQ